MRKLGRIGFLFSLGATSALVLAGCSGSTAAAPAQTPEPEAPPPAAEEPVIAVEAPAQASVTVYPGLDLDTIRAGRFDNGKMWTFEYPPTDYLREIYDFAPDPTWFERARLGALRLPNCTASFVSPNGLVMTNHHCAREGVSAVSTADEQLLDEGFYARSLDEERRVEEMHVDQLIEIIDVSDEVFGKLESATTDMERARMRDDVTEAIAERMSEERGGEEAGIVVEIISLWDAARYSAYVFQRYSDVRLVMAPELRLGQFGGDPDNFTFPRYSLDMSFLRVYGEDGNPLQSENYFEFAARGVSERDLVFVVGNPGSTNRLQTVAQLEFRRAVEDRAVLDFYSSRARALQAFYDKSPEEGEAIDLRNTIFSLLNSKKVYEGMLAGLHDPVIMAKRRDAERSFVAAIESDPALASEYGGLVERLAEIQTEKARLAPEFGAFLALGNPDLTAATLMRGLWGLQYAAGSRSGAPADALEQVKEEILSVGEQPTGMQEVLLAERLRDFQRHFGQDDPTVQGVLRGGTPESAARTIIAGSVLSDSAGAAAAVESGSLTLGDPAIEAVSAFLRRYGTYVGAIQDLSDQEDEVAAALGRARFEVLGTTIPPDATFSLRIADGVVMGYEYNGTIAPTHTTFYGLYDHYYSYGAGTDWDLPERWLNAPSTFDRSKPLNFVLTADITGGNSGSPILNRDLEVVGLAFDGNIESLPGDYIYDPTANRTIAVDVQGILEALDEIYDADRIVLELTSGRLARTEEEADAVLVGRD